MGNYEVLDVTDETSEIGKREAFCGSSFVSINIGKNAP
jgi:hypothetical protein